MDTVTAYLEDELKRSEAELDALRRQAEGVHARITKLEAVVVGLRHLISKREPTLRKFSAPDEWILMPRTEAVLRLLQTSDAPLAPREMSVQLREKGREDSPNAVSGALSRLKTTGRVQPYGHNRWIASGKVEEHSTNGQVVSEEFDRLLGTESPA